MANSSKRVSNTAAVPVAETHVTGNRGQIQANADFLRLDWGPIPNSTEDAGVGIDLFILARNRSSQDLGHWVTAQVKSGPSAFAQPTRGTEIPGWFFREEDTKHLDYWLAQPLPHLVILCDLEARVSYWVHVTPDRVKRTGKGWKILVPDDNRIDEGNREKLERVAAASAMTMVGLQGSAWSTPQHMSREDIWRCALLAPRLVAPHPNMGFSQPLRAVQAMALLIQDRMHDYFQFKEAQEGVPELALALRHEQREWRLVGATHAWFSKRDPDPLLQLAADAGRSHEIAITTVLAATALMEGNRLASALDVVSDARQREKLGELDRAWLSVHLAWIHSELGDTSDAIQLALSAINTLRHSRTLPVAAIRAAGIATWWRLAGAWALTESSEDEAADGDQLQKETEATSPPRLPDVIRGIDTQASWWRAQTIAGALAGYVDDNFLEWSNAKINRWVAFNGVEVGLVGAARTAVFTGDMGSAAGITKTLARYRLMTRTDPGDIRDALDSLRWYGDEEGVKHAASRLVVTGPLQVLQEIGRNLLVTDRWTRSSSLANLRFWQVAGDVLETDVASQAVSLCREAFENEDHVLRQRARRGFLHHDELLETIAALITGVDDKVVHAEVAAWLLGICEAQPVNGLREMAVVRLVDALNWSNIAGHERQRWLDWATSESTPDGAALPLLAKLAAVGYAPATKLLLHRAAKGSVYSLAHGWPDDKPIPEQLARPLVQQLAGHLRRRMAEAQERTYTWEGQDWAASLAWLNVSSPDAADWPIPLDYLRQSDVPMKDKVRTCHYLAAAKVQIPPDIEGLLRESLEDVGNGTEVWAGNGESLQGAVFALGIKVGGAEAKDIEKKVLHLIRSSVPDDRRTAARTLRDIDQLSLSPQILVPLLGDSDIDVAVAAATAIAKLATTSEDSALREALIAALERPGTSVPLAALSWVSTGCVREPWLCDLIAKLTKHESASVRHRATMLIQQKS